MAEVEFGIRPGQRPTNGEVREMSGFDAFYGPDEFQSLVRDRGDDIGTLLYVRASDTVDKLKNPGIEVEHPLLSDARLRRIIRAHSVTVNIDNLDAKPENRINDTKAYMPELGLGYVVNSREDVTSQDLAEFFHETRGIDPVGVTSGEIRVRGKPLLAAYGGYGQFRGCYQELRFRKKLKSALRSYGACIIQPELPVPHVVNVDDGAELAYIDRLFLGMVGGEPQFLGGLRTFMPVAANDYEMGRIHCSRDSFVKAIVQS